MSKKGVEHKSLTNYYNAKEALPKDVQLGKLKENSKKYTNELNLKPKTDKRFFGTIIGFFLLFETENFIYQGTKLAGNPESMQQQYWLQISKQPSVGSEKSINKFYMNPNI